MEARGESEDKPHSQESTICRDYDRRTMAKAEFIPSDKAAGLSEITRFDVVDAVVRPDEVSELNHHHCKSMLTSLNSDASWRRW